MPVLEARRRLPAGSAWGQVESPIGPLTLVVTPAGLLRLGFGPLGPNVRDPAPPDHAPPLAGHEFGGRIIRELAQYFAGARKEFTVPVDWSLTSGVQRSILNTLYSAVPYGSTVGYGELAQLAGRGAGASRLVGAVMGSNPVAIVVPCHRVIAADGGIGGFGGGVESKRMLLALEGSLPATLF
jgi:methylated-DNA-[protein]-cysteine S-methyltransferase